MSIFCCYGTVLYMNQQYYTAQNIANDYGGAYEY